MIAHTRLFHLLCFASMMLALSACQDDQKPEEFSLSSYAGQWLVINYWAEWCAPCIKEIPELNKLNETFANQLTVVAVNFDGVKGEKLSVLGNKMGIKFHQIENDPADLLRLARPMSLPTTYLFDPEGQLAFKLVGPQTAESLVDKMGIHYQ
tara:strand:+ start:142 stop:597 length:456 start_codon:yes stop_codon:yes gene_type:complete